MPDDDELYEILTYMFVVNNAQSGNYATVSLMSPLRGGVYLYGIKQASASTMSRAAQSSLFVKENRYFTLRITGQNISSTEARIMGYRRVR